MNADKKATQIGWYNLKEDTVFYNNGYECAAWYEQIAVPAGRYPVVVYDYRLSNRGEVEGHVNSCVICMEGTIVSDYFGSLFCGMSIGKVYDTKQNAGKSTHYCERPYLFQMVDSLLHEEDTPFELLPEWEVRTYEYTSLFDGEVKTSAGIFERRCN